MILSPTARPCRPPRVVARTQAWAAGTGPGRVAAAAAGPQPRCRPAWCPATPRSTRQLLLHRTRCCNKQPASVMHTLLLPNPLQAHLPPTAPRCGAARATCANRLERLSCAWPYHSPSSCQQAAGIRGSNCDCSSWRLLFCVSVPWPCTALPLQSHTAAGRTGVPGPRLHLLPPRCCLLLPGTCQQLRWRRYQLAVRPGCGCGAVMLSSTGLWLRS